MADNEEMEVMSEVELSSDEEEQEEDDEVSLIVLKRPPVITRKVQEIEVKMYVFFLLETVFTFISRLLIQPKEMEIELPLQPRKSMEW